MSASISATAPLRDRSSQSAADLVVAEVAPADPFEQTKLVAADTRRGRGEQGGQLALAQVVADRLARHRLGPEDAEEVVAHLERLAEWKPERAQGLLELVEPARERRAQVEGALDRVLAGLVPLDRARLRGATPTRRGGAQIQVLADAELDAELVEHPPRIGRDRTHQDVGVHEGEVADEDGCALAEPTGLAPPAGALVLGDEGAVHRGLAATSVRSVHDVVVDQREAVEQLERGAGVDRDLVVRTTAGPDVGPVTEGRAQSLPACGDERTQGVEGTGERGIDAAPPVPLGVEEQPDPLDRPFPYLAEARRRTGDSRDGIRTTHRMAP